MSTKVKRNYRMKNIIESNDKVTNKYDTTLRFLSFKMTKS